MSQDVLILVVSVAGFVSGLACVLGHLFLYFALKARGVRTVRLLSNAPFYPVLLYVHNRDAVRSRGLDFLALVTATGTVLLIPIFLLLMKLGVF